SYLVARRGGSPESDSHLVVVNANGGFAAAGYLIYTNEEALSLQLYLNPFEFFRKAFETDRFPKPDPTTISGRRVFYSHVDGEGWRILTEIGGYRRGGDLSARVVLEKVLRAFPDLPVTVAPIAADIDPDWYGTPKSVALARAMLALPHVEAGSHTY